jgi:hypothetical protein
MSVSVIDDIGMTFNFREAGKVSITMHDCVTDTLDNCAVKSKRATPAAFNLFDLRDTTRATESEGKWFRTKVAKVLYLAKTVRPVCLTAVAFLTTRVQKCDIDDLLS